MSAANPRICTHAHIHMALTLKSMVARVTPLPLLLLSLASCAPVGNLLLTGHLQDPTSGTAEPSPPAVEPTPATTPSSASPVAERRPPTLPINTTFTHGQWHLQRTSRALYGWTGTGEQFRLFAVELDTDVTCWYSQHADRPGAQHCLDGDAPLSSVRAVRNGKEVENIFSSGFEKLPWKMAGADTPLPEGTYTLPDASGRGAGTLEHTAEAVTVRTDWSRWQRAFAVPSGSNAYLVDGSAPDLFDGCTSANGTVSVIDGIRVQVGKKTCDMLRGREGTTATLSIGQSVLSFSRRDEAPNLAEERRKAAQARQKVGGNAQIQLDVSGDATHTLLTAAARKPNGEGRSGVEANATIQGVHYRCEASVERFDPAWVQTVKRICGSMAK